MTEHEEVDFGRTVGRPSWDKVTLRQENGSIQLLQQDDEVDVVAVSVSPLSLHIHRQGTAVC